MKSISKKGLICGINETKKALREKFLRKRNALSRKERRKRSISITKRIVRLPTYEEARILMIFLTHGSEVLTEFIIRKAWQDDKIVVVPVADIKRHRLTAVKLYSLNEGLRSGAYGIREPKLSRSSKVAPRQIDAVFVPGIVFDASGHRIGYGKGYFDSWLKKIPFKRRIGLCFEFQLQKNVPNTKDDLKVSTIVTEARVLNIKRRGR